MVEQDHEDMLTAYFAEMERISKEKEGPCFHMDILSSFR